MSSDERLRIGVLIPSGNPTLEVELPWAEVPETSFHFQRLTLAAGSDPATLRRMADESGPSATLLGHVRPAAVLYGCTTGSMIGGAELEAEIEAAIHGVLDVPVVFTARAVVEALRRLGAQRVAVGTPYLPGTTEVSVRYLEEHGIEVTGRASLSLTDGVEISELGHEELTRLIEEVDSPQAQAIFLSCTSLTTLDAIADWEARFGKPVVTSNSAALRATLDVIGRRSDRPELGILFS